MKTNALVFLTSLFLGAGLIACGGDGGNNDSSNGSSNSSSNNGDSNKSSSNGSTSKLATGEGPCEAAEVCKGNVCVALIDGDNPPNYCTQECDNSQCPQGFVCDKELFSLAGLTFCRFAPDQPDEPAPTPEEPPTLPCKSDSDCDNGMVCASAGGERGCAMPCTVESDCTPPALNGVSIDILTCGEDDDKRSVCLPDPACFPNATSCISGFPGF